MLLVGPSKSGKSFALIELCIAITEGTEWIGRKCKQGNVLYVNFELDRPSCLHRFEDVYNSLGIPEGKRHSKNLYTWNLRGKTLTLDKLVPKLIRRAKKRNYRAVVIDPIYKVITGDENSASEMANFCNQFDKIAEATGASVIYAHHHSKGAQGSKKSMDRASGSGVFARDPDALLDMIELDIPKEVKDKFRKEAEVETIKAVLDRAVPNWRTYIYKTLKTDENDLEAMNNYCAEMLDFDQMTELEILKEKQLYNVDHMSALQISGTLREFASFDPVNVFFKYPLHYLDNNNLLKGCSPDKSSRKSKYEKMNEAKQKEQDENVAMLINAFEQLNVDGEASLKDIASSGLVAGKTIEALRKSVTRWIKSNKLEGFEYSQGIIKKTGGHT